MRTGRPKAPLTLTPNERRELESLAHRSRSAPALARRARIVLACAEGRASKTVARRIPQDGSGLASERYLRTLHFGGFPTPSTRPDTPSYTRHRIAVSGWTAYASVRA